jgi:CPA1 family monovalent cation:H+ antiporter
MTFTECVVFGSIISATDPVAVVALLKELGASKRLATLIEGESLLNDGTAVVILMIATKMAEGEDITVG